MRKHLKFLDELQQRKEKFNNQQSHPIYGGYDPSKDKRRKKKKLKVKKEEEQD